MKNNSSSSQQGFNLHLIETEYVSGSNSTINPADIQEYLQRLDDNHVIDDLVKIFQGTYRPDEVIGIYNNLKNNSNVFLCCVDAARKITDNNLRNKKFQPDNWPTLKNQYGLSESLKKEHYWLDSLASKGELYDTMEKDISYFRPIEAPRYIALLERLCEHINAPKDFLRRAVNS